MTETENSGLATRAILYARKGLVNPRIVKFGIVGVSGIGVNMGFLYLLTEYVGIPYFVGSLVAIEISIISNFWLNHLWTWRDRSESGTLWSKVVRYHIGAGLTAVLGNYVILVSLTEFFHVNYLLSNLAGIAVGTVANFIVNDLWTFRSSARRSSGAVGDTPEDIGKGVPPK